MLPLDLQDQPTVAGAIASGMFYRFSVQEYQHLCTGGFFPPETRTELIEGAIVAMSPIGTNHAACVNSLTKLLILAVMDQAIVSVQNSVQFPNSQPQPDLALLKPRADQYRHQHPQPVDCWLLIEVADSTVRYDRTVKGLLYAQNGIPEFWLVNLEAGQLEIYRDPSPEGYQTKLTRSPQGLIAPQQFPQAEIPLGNLLLKIDEN